MYLTLPVRFPVAVTVYVTWWPAGSAWEVAEVVVIAAAAANVAAAIPVVTVRTFVISETLPNALPPYPENGFYHASVPTAFELSGGPWAPLGGAFTFGFPGSGMKQG
jgi:hypothetical protein